VGFFICFRRPFLHLFFLQEFFHTISTFFYSF
jgi:hypothetical protein